MKAKFWILALAALSFAACSDKRGLTPEEGGEGETSYLAIQVASTDFGTKASDGGFDVGTPDERKVNKATFYFFDSNDNPFIIDAANERSWKTVSITNNGTPATDPNIYPNISDIHVVMTLEDYQGRKPAKLVAVLNGGEELSSPTTNPSLSDLADKISSLQTEIGSSKYFVMSNSVYVDGSSNVINATTIGEVNLANTPESANTNKLTVYVERLAAKVGVTTENDATVFNTSESTGITGSTSPVYAKILGWDLYNDLGTSYLLKHVDATSWNATNPLVTTEWNDANNYRSYWATSPSDATYNNQNILSTPNDVNASVYIGENTKADNKTKVFVSAQLTSDAEGNTPVAVGVWQGVNYAGDDLLKAVAASLRYEIYPSADGNTTISYQDLAINQGVDESIYSSFKLSTAGEAKTWYKKEGSTFTSLTNVEVNAYLATLPEAVYYPEGKTYYFTDIKHLGDAVGIVRNHSYQINITGVSGFGTPFIPGNIVTPEKPEQTETYLSSEIKILSWKIVSQNVELK